MGYLSLLVFLIFIVACLFWASRSKLSAGWRSEDIFNGSIVSKLKNKETLKVMTWNFAYAFGLGSEGKNYVPRSREDYLNRLKNAANLIKLHKPDLVFLQEVDLKSARSFYINQAEFLAKACGYDYFSPSVSWQANYVPFPYWPLSSHFGETLSGGAILSHFPILSSETYLFEKRAQNPWWYNLFYPYRYFQNVLIQINDRKVSIINLHLEAFDSDERKKQLSFVKSKSFELKPIIVAGDFNTHFEANIAIEGMREVVTNPTFPSNNPSKTLDHLYVKKLKLESAQVVEQDISDHNPIVAQFSFEKLEGADQDK